MDGGSINRMDSMDSMDSMGPMGSMGSMNMMPRGSGFAGSGGPIQHNAPVFVNKME